MARRSYQWLTPETADQIWIRLREGKAAKPTARELGLSTGTVRAYLMRCGGIRPDPRRRAPARLTMTEREEISRGLAAGHSVRQIAAGLGRAPWTICREVNTNGGARRYRASRADPQAWARAARPKRCKLAGSPQLRAIVDQKLQRRWSPQQIAGWLKLICPSCLEMQVSHETIYRTLYVQSRGALASQLPGPDSRHIGSLAAVGGTRSDHTACSRGGSQRPGDSDRLREAFGPVAADDAHVGNAAVARLGEHRYHCLAPSPGRCPAGRERLVHRRR